MTELGWIKLHRELKNKAIWQESTPEQKVVLITLLMMANHKEREWEWKGQKYIAKPGQMVTSLPSIVKECGKGISTQNVRTALKRFEKYGFLTDESTKQNRLITIVNWDLYQVEESETNRQANSQLTDTQQTANSQLTANKNDKNDNNDNNDDVISKILQDKILSEINILVSNQISSSRLNELISKFGIEPINILIEELDKSTWLKENITWNISQGFLDKVIAGDFRDYKKVKKTKTENQFNNFQGQSKNYTEEELNQMAKNIRKRRVASD